MNNEQLLLEVDDLLRSMPDRGAMSHNLPENHEWLGRAAALVSMWNPGDGAAFEIIMMTFQTAAFGSDKSNALNQMLVKLTKMRTNLLLQTRGALNVAVSAGNVFDYF